VAKSLTAALLFILPLIVIPLGISPFEAPKVVIAEVVILLLAITRFNLLSKFKVNKFQTIYLLFFAILFLLTLYTLFTSSYIYSLFGNPIRLQGVFLLWCLMVFTFTGEKLWRLKKLRALYLLSALTLFSSTLILGINQNSRAFGTLGEPNALAAVALFFYTIISFWEEKKFKWLTFLGTLIVIFLSDSRSALVGFFIVNLFILLTQYLKLALSKAVIISLILLTFSFILPLLTPKLWFESRAEIWKTAFFSGLESPFFGQGFGNIQPSIASTAKSLNNNVQYQVVDSSHNFLLDFWVQGGVLGVIPIIGLIHLSLLNFIGRKSRLELALLLGVLTVMSFNPVSVSSLLLFWYLIGQGFGE